MFMVVTVMLRGVGGGVRGGGGWGVGWGVLVWMVAFSEQEMFENATCRSQFAPVLR